MRKIIAYCLSTLFCIAPFAPTAHAFLNDPIVSAWMPVSWDTDEARTSFESHIDLFDEISPFQYLLHDDGSIEVYKHGDDASLVSTAHNSHVRVIPTITNSFSGDTFHAVVSDKTKRQQLIDGLIEKITTFNYDGIDIDFEGVKKTDKQAFTDFLKDIAKEVHSRNKLLTIAIQARTPDTPADYSTWSQDWDAIGATVDRFRIMTYDKHWQTSNAGAVSPTPWIKAVAEYAEKHVPKDKIVMGLPFYGYNWPCKPGDWNDCAHAISDTFDQAQEWLVKYDVPLGWDGVNEEPYFTYKLDEAYGSSPQTERVVYMQNAASIHSKLITLGNQDVNGIAIWRLGHEDPGSFDSIKLGMRNAAPLPDFTDIAPNYWAYDYIQPLKNRGIIEGIKNTFYPDRTVSKAEALKMILGDLKLPKLTYAEQKLADVKKTDWSYWYLQTALTRGWIDYPDSHKVNGWHLLTRAEAAKLLVKANNVSVAAPDSHFTDVPSNHPLIMYIDAAKQQGWMQGYDDGTFKPDQPISRAEFAKLLAKSRTT